MSETKKGGCLCGAVRFEADLPDKHYHACHCSTCRKWSGPAMATAASAVRTADDAPLKSYPSSDYGERVFCAECGTHLMWRMQDQSMIFVWLGALDASDDMTFGMQIFIDSKPAHYTFANETKMMTGEEVYAASSGEL